MNTQDELDNHANQLNPNNDAYWQSRGGYDERPDDWDDDDYHYSSNTEDDDDEYYDYSDACWSSGF